MTARNPGFGCHVYVYGMWDRGIDARGLWMGRDPESPGCEIIRITEIGRLRSDGASEWRAFGHPEMDFSIPTPKVHATKDDIPFGTPFGDEVATFLLELGLKVGPRPRREPGVDQPGSHISDDPTTEIV